MPRSYRPVTVDRPAAVRAAESVLRRRTDAPTEDPDLWRFPGTDDLFGVVEYVHRHQRVPADVLAEDALAALSILNFLAGDLDRRRLYALRLARRCGLTWRAIADASGLRSLQSAEQTWLRLESLFEDDDHQRREAAGRALRRRPRRPAASGTETVVDDPDVDEVRKALGQLLDLEEMLPEDLADDLLDLRREATPRRAELSGAQLARALRAMVINEMRGRSWPAPVQDALDRLVAAVAHFPS